MKKTILLLLLSTISLIAPAQVTTGLIAYYPFDGTFGDSSGNGHHLTQRNGVSFAADHLGNANQAAAFNGVNQWAFTPMDAQLTTTTELTITMWFQPDIIDAEQSLITISDTPSASASTNNQKMYKVMYGAHSWVGSDNVDFETHHQGICAVNDMQESTTSDSLINHNWRFIAVIFDHGLKKVYDNGTLAAVETVSSAMNYPNAIDGCGGGVLKFGTWWKGDPEYMQGRMDEVRIYNRVLTATEIDTLFTLDPTGVVSVSGNNAGLRISPIPATSALTVSSLDNSLLNGNMIISTVTGEVIKNEWVSSNSFTTSVRDLSSGVYFLTLRTAQGVITTRFIKQ